MKLKLSIFSNYGTVPLQIAVERGFFEEVGLDVEINSTNSSIEQMTGLIDGRYDIAATAIDNIIAYNCGQGAVPIATTPDLKVFLGSASYSLPFVVTAGIEEFKDLAGHTIAVDAISTGFAFLLRELLEINGLNAKDYTFKSFGAPKERWNAVQSGEAAGALLNAHFEAIAHTLNCNTLNSTPNPWDNYEGNTFCARVDFLKGVQVDAFNAALLNAVAFTKNPGNTDAVAAALNTHIANLPPSKAVEVARSLQGTESIIDDQLRVSHGGVIEVLRLREKYTATRLNLTPEELCDPRVVFAP